MGSYFKGWTNTLPHIQSNTIKGGTQDLFIGQVLKVFYKRQGKINVRIVGVSRDLEDDDIVVEAYPANMNIVKYPLPGEIVVLFTGIENAFKGSKPAIAYYYLSVISTNQNLSYNSNPHALHTVPEQSADRVFDLEYEHRFERKIENLRSFLLDPNNIETSLIDKKTLKPAEGDVILQGRFGAGIRLGGTVIPTNDDKGLADILFGSNPNGSQWSQKSVAGSPVIVLSSNARQDTLSYEDVNQSDVATSTMHICSDQQIPIEMATSMELKSHRHKYDVSKLISTTSDLTAFLKTTYVPGQVYTGPTNMVFGGGGGGVISGTKLVISHAGNWDGAGRVDSENNITNIESNIKNGTQIVEIDIQVTKDGVPVLFHDPNLSDKTNGTGTVASNTWAQVQAFKYKTGGGGIPRLEDVCALLGKYNSPSILQFDQCGNSEWGQILKIPNIAKYSSKFMAKGSTFSAFSNIKGKGIAWQPILPDSYVGKVTTPAIVQQIVTSVQQSGATYMELQFSLGDTLILDGTLAKSCAAVGCGLVGIAITGNRNTNPNYVDGKNWNDSEDTWNKYFSNLGCVAVMTNKPQKMKTYLSKA